MKFISTLLFVIAFVATLSEGQSPGVAPIVESKPPKGALLGSQVGVGGSSDNGEALDNGTNDESDGQDSVAGLPQGEAGSQGDDSEEPDAEAASNDESEEQHGDFRLPKNEPSTSVNGSDEDDDEENGEADNEDELVLEEIDVEGSGDDATNAIDEEADFEGLELPDAEGFGDDESEGQYGDFRLPKDVQRAAVSASNEVAEEQIGDEEPVKDSESPREESNVDNEL
ncbi:acidic leucine-rich nuclear phosphoprotein 32 family member B-like [Ceratitis capitata]|uniref:acidic leucine-rich nuclear phosphoprotein 32 family member B-like n=1 Tax=Ceratitis capitata TaxID=7213 RepID=UPI000329A4CB|nr:acidic leucine-rich nuclear phosphoprotein 32 family member B-like [Ceratitis capitata]